MIAQARAIALAAVGVEVVGYACDPRELGRLVRTAEPTHVLLGASAPGYFTPRDRGLLRRLRRLAPDMAVASIVDPDDLLEMAVAVGAEVLLVSASASTEGVRDALFQASLASHEATALRRARSR